MAEQEVQEAGMEMQVPATGGGKKKMIIWILVAIVLLGIGVVVILLLTGSAKEDEADVQALLDDIPVVEEVIEEEVEEVPDVLTVDFLSNLMPSFDYTDDWQWAAVDQVDGISFSVKFALSQEPIHFCDGCRSDGGPIFMNSRFLTAVDLGEFENFTEMRVSNYTGNYTTAEAEQTIQNGSNVTVIITTSEEPGDEGAVLHGKVVIYETDTIALEIVYRDTNNEEEDAAWELLGETIDFSAID